MVEGGINSPKWTTGGEGEWGNSYGAKFCDNIPYDKLQLERIDTTEFLNMPV